MAEKRLKHVEDEIVEELRKKKGQPGRPTNEAKNRKSKKKDLRCRVTEDEYEKIAQHFKGTKSAFILKAVNEHIKRIENEMVSTSFSVEQWKVGNVLRTQKFGDFEIGLIVDVLTAKDRDHLLVKMQMKLGRKMNS